MNYSGLVKKLGVLPAATIFSSYLAANVQQPVRPQQPSVYEQLLPAVPRVERLDFDGGMKCFRAYNVERQAPAISDTDTYCGSEDGKRLAFVDGVRYDPASKISVMTRICMYDKKPEECPAAPSGHHSMTTTAYVKKGADDYRSLYGKFVFVRSDWQQLQKIKKDKE